jgi:hypothetical protein
MELHKVNVARRAEALVLAQAKRDSEAKHAQFKTRFATSTRAPLER